MAEKRTLADEQGNTDPLAHWRTLHGPDHDHGDCLGCQMLARIRALIARIEAEQREAATWREEASLQAIRAEAAEALLREAQEDRDSWRRVAERCESERQAVERERDAAEKQLREARR